jgi:hypothetical protein
VGKNTKTKNICAVVNKRKETKHCVFNSKRRKRKEENENEALIMK